MLIKQNTKLLMFSGLCACCLISLNLFGFKQQQNVKALYFAPPQTISYFAFGFHDLYADILWMRLLQDIDFCNSKKGIPDYKQKQTFKCKKAWSFKMANAITELAPNFLSVYTMVGSILSVIMGDKEGAKILYDKALKRFPNHWKLHFYAAYHYLLELNQDEQAAKLLVRAADLGGPYWLYALAAKSYSKLGKLELAKKVLTQSLQRNVTKKYKKSLLFKLQAIEQQINTLK